MLDSTTDSELMLNRFNRLIRELLQGRIKRNTFRPWEIQILLDLDSCELNGSNRRETLRRYQKAVQRQMENGATDPMKFSEYLASKKRRRKQPANGNGTKTA